jgi:ABC-type transport system involved in cytochrome bd biosynthesis fused ATPase/permease subunit
VSDFERLRTWLVRAAPRRFDLIKALFMASVASLAGTGLFVGALALLVVSAERPGLRAIAVFLIAIELVAFLRSPLRFGERMSTHRLGFAAVTRWRQWLMSTVGTWSFSRWQRYGTGDLLERSLTDTDELQDLWLRGVIPSVATLVTMVASDAVVSLLAPRGQWWPVAVATAVVQILMVTALVSRLGAQVRCDRRLRTCRGAYLASLVSSRAAAPEIERLGASDFLRRRDEVVIWDLRDAEDAVRRERQRDVALVVAGPLASLGVLATLHPASAPVWLVVASLVAIATFDALATLRTSVHIAVAVTGGAERLDELACAPQSLDASWPVETTLSFHDVVVAHSDDGVRQVSGVITPGRRVGVSGPSGSGKSTLLRALSRLDDVSDGDVDVGGVPLSDISEGQLRTHVVLVPSEPGLVKGYVRDVVGMGMALSDTDLAALAFLGLDVELNDQWDELSRGERQRVAIVRALVRTPEILLLDEPTSALGDAETHAVLELLSRTTSTVIVATHDARVLAWCDQVIALADGATN